MRDFFGYGSFIKHENEDYFQDMGEDSEGNFIYKMDVPGFNKDNLNIEILDNNVLSIKGEFEDRKVDKKCTLLYAEDVKASIKDGILTLTLIPIKKNSIKINIT